jgi:2-(1,2-epoxy-1,2-dihydrophenyl)acetyl-CoA isomerase
MRCCYGYRAVADGLVPYAVSDGVLHIELNRPQARNALDPPTAARLTEAVERGRGGDVRAVLLSASGRDFSVGGDIGFFVKGGPDLAAGIHSLAGTLHTAVLGLAELDVPVVSAIQGWCAGAAIGLACGADVVVAGAGARFRSAYTAIGFSPDLGLSWLLPSLVGAVRAADLIFTNRAIDAETAERWGLVSRVVPDDELLANAKAIALSIANGPAETHGVVRGLLRSRDLDGLRAALAAEQQAVAERAASDEGIEGVRAFVERRPPKFP